jgi:hypothetical protein
MSNLKMHFPMINLFREHFSMIVIFRRMRSHKEVQLRSPWVICFWRFLGKRIYEKIFSTRNHYLQKVCINFFQNIFKVSFKYNLISFWYRSSYQFCFYLEKIKKYWFDFWIKYSNFFSKISLYSIKIKIKFQSQYIFY